MSSRSIVVLIACLGCHHHARVHAPGEVWLDKIRVEGNQTIPDDDLIPGLSIERARRDGLKVDPYQLSLDTKRIRGAYQRAGFFEAKVESRIDRQDNAEIVVFTVVEGPRTTARVSVTGLPPELPEQAVLGKLELKDGAPFDYEIYDEGKEVVKAMVEDVGYPYVDLEDSVVTVDRKDRVAATSYRVVISGPRATFGPTTITGADGYPDLERAIRGRLGYREGDVYTPRVLAETQRSLFELGRFSQIQIDIDRKEVREVVPVTIDVKLAGRHELKGGGGFGYEAINSLRPYQGRVRGGFTYIPEEYPLWALSGDARVAATFNGALDDYEPKLRVFLNGQRLEWLRPYIVGNIGAGLDIFTVEAYTAAGPILRLGATAPLGVRWLTAQLGWTFSYFTFSGLPEVPIPGTDPVQTEPLIDPVTRNQLGLRGNERDGRFEQVITADLRDKPLDPRKGLYASVRLSEGTLLAGGAFRYVEIQPDVRGYVPIGERASLAFHVRGGAFVANGKIPVTQRLFSGGSQNHRGFGARALAPSVCHDPVNVTSFLCFEGSTGGRDSRGNRLDSVLIGGEALLETGAELRVPLGSLSSSVLYGITLFLDGGDVTNALGDIDPFNLYWAAGAGVFLKPGGFKIRIDVGRRITRLGPDDLLHDDSDGTFRYTTLFLGVGDTY